MKIPFCLCCAVIVLMTSCAAIMAGRYDYNLEVRNIGTNRIVECEVASAKGFYQRLGVLVPKAGDTTAGPFKYPYADKWTVAWQTTKGEKFEKTLDLTKAFPKRFEGRLVFTINATNGLGYYTTNFPGQ